MKTLTKYEAGIETKAYIIPSECPGLYTVRVMHRFDSGNYFAEVPKENLSLVAAEGVAKFYTT